MALLLFSVHEVYCNSLNLSLCFCKPWIFFVFLEEFEALLVWLVVVLQELRLALLLLQSGTPVRTVTTASVLPDLEVALLELRAGTAAKGGLARYTRCTASEIAHRLVLALYSYCSSSRSCPLWLELVFLAVLRLRA